LYRGISDFKKGYRLRSNVVKVEMDEWVAESQSFGYVEKLLLQAIAFTLG
jgi:hypothetical protein